MYKFINKIKRLDPYKIIQVSPPRSGSTLIYNLLSELQPGRYIKKEHGIRLSYRKHRVVVSYRHPLDSVVSMLTSKSLEFSTENIKKEAKAIMEGIDALFVMQTWDKVLFLKYEDFINDFDYIFDNFESFLSIKINEEIRKELKSKYNIENVKIMMPSSDDFNVYDKNTGFHANHISEYKGEPDMFAKYLDSKDIKFLQKYYSRFLKEFNYK